MAQQAHCLSVLLNCSTVYQNMIAPCVIRHTTALGCVHLSQSWNLLAACGISPLERASIKQCADDCAMMCHVLRRSLKMHSCPSNTSGFRRTSELQERVARSLRESDLFISLGFGQPFLGWCSSQALSNGSTSWDVCVLSVEVCAIGKAPYCRTGRQSTWND